MSIDMIDSNTFNEPTIIKVIGVGGGGGNAVQHMINSQVAGVEFICANTDAQALNKNTAERLIQLGENGLGAGSKPEQGREAAQNAEGEIRKALEGANMLFITAGMGGGTGTGAAPVIARIAKEMKILTVAVVTKPFDWEGSRRMKNAEEGLAELQNQADALIVVLNDKLIEVYGDDISQDEAFGLANNVLRNAVGGIAEIIHSHGEVNADFEDVKTIMRERGKAMMGTATASGPDRARIAAEQAIACPLLEGTNLTDAKGILVLVTASKGSLKLSETRTAVSTINGFTDEDVEVKFGTSYDDSMGDEIRVTVLATGLQDPQKRQQTFNVVQGELATGTDSRYPLQGYARQNTLSNPNQGMRKSFSGLDSVAAPGVWTSPRGVNGGNNTFSASNTDIETPAFLRRQAD